MGSVAYVIQDGATVTKKLRGDERASDVADLFSREYMSLHRLAYVFLGDAALAEEVVMEAFVKVFSGWHRFRSVDHKVAYLRQVVVNLCRGKLRRQGIERRVNEATHRDRSRGATLESEHADLHLDLWNAVRRLPERQRSAVVLRYLEDLPEAEIAEIMDCSIGTVKSQLSRARQKLEDLLQAQGVLDE